MLKDILAIYLPVVNIIGAYVMWEDKRRAQSNAWRISEKALFLTALLGGGLGTTFGMFYFRHKTKHWYFKYGMPAILLIETVFLCVL